MIKESKYNMRQLRLDFFGPKNLNQLMTLLTVICMDFACALLLTVFAVTDTHAKQGTRLVLRGKLFLPRFSQLRKIIARMIAGSR